ncbi:ubiquitin carboxyl-terminal hydrolase 8 isoform X2 [Nasonia vitripennis]|uniref:Ubiquitin carboxyl-terminal hydrolase n=1 Tax=Nasonia vitripennis TaxID=7425 RepID=A0A7M7QD81_NASVI|nr:ubiquitin carboxyl-terminal hydrolase 8 isoform X2 [Nasonia vitripennis]
MQNMDPAIVAELNEKYRNLNKEVLKLNFKGRKPEHIYERLPKIYASGSEAKEANKHDQAYIFFKRWIACVDWLKGQHLNKEVITKFFSNDKVEDVKKLLQEVSNSIQLECEIKPKGPQIKDSHTNSVNENFNDLELRLPETPNDEPQPKENDEITCADLFNILNQGIRSSEKRLLIIDVRKEEDYLESKIPFPENIVHIPAEKIQPNKSPDFYRYLLIDDNLALDRYAKRSAKDIDIIVLMDSNSSLNSMNVKSPISMFKKSLKECDKNTKYKRIAILKGGFEEWIKTYPAFVTDPVKKELSPTPSTPDSSVSSFNASYSFLNISQSREETTSPILSGRHPTGPRVKDPSNANSQVSSRSDKSSSSLYNHLLVPYQKVLASSTIANGKYTHPTTQPSQNNNPTAPPPPNCISDKQLLISNNMKEAKVVIEKLKPQVDRSKKPTLGGKPTMPTTNQLEKELSDTQYSILQYEKKLQKGMQNNWAREQLETLRKKEQEIMVKLGRTRNTRSADGNPGKLYPELSLSSMTLEPRTRATRLSKLNLSEEKENIPKPPIKDKIEPMIVDPQPPLTPAHMEVDEEETIRREPLKSENVSINPGLKRSHSSPNLVLQNGPKSIPAVNRSLKPNLVPKNVSRTRIPSAISSKGRELRLEPIFSSIKLHPGITGLKNLGNSCYMNSIIQCLSNTVYLAKYFNDNKYTDHLNRNIDKVARGYVAEEVAQVIKALWRGQYKSISPRDLKNVIGQYKMQFENFDQQDSHEFLMFLLDWMHNDLKQKIKTRYDRALTIAETEWEKSMNGQSSVISKLFFGQLRSTIECLYCNQNSTTYETFNSLTMSLPTTNKCTLDECVKKFVSGQRVSGWKCPNCKVPREGMKKFDIAKLPHIIVIHLNRFGETSGWLEKKNTAVDFPLTNFIMRHYVVQDNDNFNNSQSYNYNLYAMSNHYGTMEGGHYTAYCKSNHQNKWYKYDDHTVSEVQANVVKNQSTSAYLLFYALASAENYLNS